MLNRFPEDVNKDLLWHYIYREFGIRIPRQKICEEHDPPFDFVYHAFMGTYKTILAMANRTGGKTLSFAIIDLLHAKGNDDCEVATLGAIQAQAERCYNYVKRFIANSPEYSQFVAGDPLMSKSRFINDSMIEILVATITGVNSPHPQKATIDEVELIPWNILQEAWSMTTSKGEIPGQLILGSTRKFAVGPMSKLISEKLKRNIRVFSWCIWEVMERVPVDRLPEIKALFGDRLPVKWGMMDGFYRWDDAIDKFQTMDVETWETQWECKKPDSSGLVYPRFSDELNIAYDFKLNLSPIEGKYLYISEDFGYAKDHPDMISFNQVDVKREEVVTFDELRLVHKDTEEIIAAVDDRLKEHGLTRANVAGWITDKAGATERADRMNLGLPIVPLLDNDSIDSETPLSKLYEIKNSVPLVRTFIDKRKYKLTPNCIYHRQDFMSYKYKQLADGSYSQEAEKKNDHGPDNIRYLLLTVFPSLALGAIGDVITEKRIDPTIEVESVSDTLTGGMMDRPF